MERKSSLLVSSNVGPFRNRNIFTLRFQQDILAALWTQTFGRITQAVRQREGLHGNMKSKEDQSSVLHWVCRSPSHAALPVGTKALQERAQTAPPAFHIEQFITSQRLHLQKCPAELTQKSQNPFWKFGIWKLDQQQSYGEHIVHEPLLGDPTAHWERMGVTTWGSGLGSQRAGIGNWHRACIATGLLKPEHRTWQSSLFASRSQEAKLSPNTIKVSAETSGCWSSTKWSFYKHKVFPSLTAFISSLVWVTALGKERTDL